VPSRGPDPGQLLYLDAKDVTLKTQPFDDTQVKTVGNPTTIVGPVGIFSTSYPFFSASANGVLVYRGGASVLSRATWFNRQGKPLGEITEPETFSGLSISPDEKQVAASLVKSNGWANLWLFDSKGLRPKNKFTYGPDGNLNPIWSPEGNYIVFASLPRDLIRGEKGVFSLYQKPLNGSKEKEILKSSENLFPTSWSRDGRFLLYHEYDPRTLKSKLWVLSMEGDRKAEKFLNTESNEIDGHFSRDG
jgi:hypothetical protein